MHPRVEIGLREIMEIFGLAEPPKPHQGPPVPLRGQGELKLEEKEKDEKYLREFLVIIPCLR